MVEASIFGANLGDTLWVTPLSRYEPDLTVWMRGDDPKARSVAPILDGLCKVRLEPNPPETRKAPIRAHVTQQILAAYGHQGKPSIPRVVLKPDEVEWAIGFLRGLIGEHTSPGKVVGLVNHCSGSADPTNYRAHYVRGNPEAYAQIARFWRAAGYKVLQFGPAPGFYTQTLPPLPWYQRAWNWVRRKHVSRVVPIDIVEPIEKVIQVRGLSVRQLAAMYHVIGKLISPDTGDYHLMLAVGGKVACLVPPHSDELGYCHWDLHYDAICWGDERPRARYIQHGDYTDAMSTKLFTRIGA